MPSDSSLLTGHGYLPAGTQLNGIYEIDAPLATGGMGQVYRGHEIQTGDPVAIKLIRSDLATDEVILALFRREASALNRLHHEAIVRYFVFSLDPVLKRHYLAMELVEGESLSALLKRGPLPVPSVIALQRRVASGLHAAHLRGVIHRDVSPDNVIVHEGDVAHARIIDFGIARSSRVGETTVLGGGFAGKFNYVSPEQLGLFGGDVTGKSDMYSLGLVLACALRGHPIDMAGTQADVLEKRRQVPDLSDIDPVMRPLLRAMLQPDPKDRPASLADVAAWQPPVPSAAEATVIAPATVPPPAARTQTPPRTVEREAEPDQVRQQPRRARTVDKPAKRRDSEGASLSRTIAALVVLAILGVGGFIAFLQWGGGDNRRVIGPQANLDPNGPDPGPSRPGPDARPLDEPRPRPNDTPPDTRPPTSTDQTPSTNNPPSMTTDTTPPVTQPRPNTAPPTDNTPPVTQPRPNTGPPTDNTPPATDPRPGPNPPSQNNNTVIGNTSPQPEPVDPLTERMRQFVRGFDGGKCFVALPVLASASAPEIDSFGLARKPLEDFYTQFKDRIGVDANGAAGPVNALQCPIIEFLAKRRDMLRARGLTETAPKLEFLYEAARGYVYSGETVRGAVATTAPNVELLLIDDAGEVQNATVTMRPSGDRREFGLRLERGPGPQMPYLIMAVASAEPILALKFQGKMPADGIIAALSKAVESAREPPAITMKFLGLRAPK